MVIANATDLLQQEESIAEHTIMITTEKSDFDFLKLLKNEFFIY
jgi:hypothetical protein